MEELDLSTRIHKGNLPLKDCVIFSYKYCTEKPGVQVGISLFQFSTVNEDMKHMSECFT
jgi:hypothetical protein